MIARWRRGRSTRWLLRWSPFLMPLAVVAFLMVGYANWVPASFSGQVATRCTLGCSEPPFPSHALPAKVNVTIRWEVVTGGPVGFYVAPPYGVGLSQCYWPDAWGGSCTIFSPLGGNYTFDVYSARGTTSNGTVDYTGSYLTSLL